MAITLTGISNPLNGTRNKPVTLLLLCLRSLNLSQATKCDQNELHN